MSRLKYRLLEPVWEYTPSKITLMVLWDGTVVPCCLDHDGDIPLGNLLQEDLADILASPTAEAILEGFTQGKAVHPLCRRCGFAHQRFR